MNKLIIRRLIRSEPSSDIDEWIQFLNKLNQESDVSLKIDEDIQEISIFPTS